MCSHEAVHAKAPLWWRDAKNGFKVATPQRGNLLLCEDDGWFYWFSHRECVPMTKWSTRTWRWRKVVDGVFVLQFWWCVLGWWLFCCIFLSKKFWSLSCKKKLWTSTTPEILIVVLKNGERTTICVRSLLWKILPALWISNPCVPLFKLGKCCNQIVKDTSYCTRAIKFNNNKFHNSSKHIIDPCVFFHLLEKNMLLFAP